MIDSDLIEDDSKGAEARPEHSVVTVTSEWFEQRAVEIVTRETKALTGSLIAREAALEARERALSERRAGSLRALRLTAAIAALASSLWITQQVIAQACVPGSSQSGVLNTFCAQTPARADQINHNFATIYNWINTKLGNPNSPNVTVNGTVSATGNVSSSSTVSGSTVTSTGPTNVGGNLSVNGRVSFPCSGCGDNGGQWGNMTIQGRVVSANSNIHLSPPGGSGVVIDSGYRNAGGGTGDVDLSVSGRIHGRLGRNSCSWRVAQTSNGTGGPDEANWYQPNGQWATWGVDNRYHIAACADGEYMAGWSCYASSYLDGNCRIYCCTP